MVELERPPARWVKPATPEPSIRRITVADVERVTAVAAAVLDQLAPDPMRARTTHTHGAQRSHMALHKQEVLARAQLQLL